MPNAGPRLVVLIATALVLGPHAAAADARLREQASSGREPGFVSVELRRSTCFGTCPAYTVSVSSEGHVRFEGRRFVDATGVHTATIPREAVAALERAIERAGFDGLADRYVTPLDGCTAFWTDHPSLDIIVTRTTGTKHVHYYYGCKGPEAAGRIDRLASAIDEIAGTSRWVRPKPAPSDYNHTMASSLTPRERAHLKARAHALEPVVHIGHDGITEALLAEIDRALTAHELIKVRAGGADRDARAAMLDEICDRTGAAAVQSVGKVMILWRPRPLDDERSS